MNKRIKKLIPFLIVGMIVTQFPAHVCATTEPADSALEAPKSIVVKQSGKKSLKLKWTKVKRATGYEIYKARKGHSAYKRVKTIKNNTVWKDDSVGAGKTSTYKVRAFKNQKGKKHRSAYSYPVSAKVCVKKDKKRNVAEVKIIHKKGYKGNFTLGYGESIIKEYDRFRVKVYGSTKKGTKETWTPINKRVRWYSSDPSIVRVKSATDIRANNKKGKCYIYAVAHNGVRSKKIPVEVKDFAYEKVDIKYAPGRIQILFEEFENEIREICSYYSLHRNNATYKLRYNGGDKVFESGKLSDRTKIPLIEKMLEDSPFRWTEIEIRPGAVHFNIAGVKETFKLSFVFSKTDCSDIYRPISPHWWYDMFDMQI